MTGRVWPVDRLQPCGTEAAYRRHLRNQEPPCKPCTAASDRAHADEPGTRTIETRAVRNNLPGFVPYIYQGRSPFMRRMARDAGLLPGGPPIGEQTVTLTPLPAPPPSAVKGAVKVDDFPAKYPFREIADDGGVWLLDPQVFSAKPASMRAAASKWANERAMTAKVVVRDEGVYVQFSAAAG